MPVPNDWKDRITFNPAVLVGKPTIRGLRISVEHVLLALAGGVPIDDFLAEYPMLERDDVRACLAYAAEAVSTHRAPSEPIGAGR